MEDSCKSPLCLIWRRLHNNTFSIPRYRIVCLLFARMCCLGMLGLVDLLLLLLMFAVGMGLLACFLLLRHRLRLKWLILRQELKAFF